MSAVPYADQHWTTPLLEKALRKDKQHLTFVLVQQDDPNVKKNYKSDVWKTMKFVKIIATGEVIRNLCACQKCESVFTYTATSGTSHLGRHLAGCTKKQDVNKRAS
jgi:hypothetical protein